MTKEEIDKILLEEWKSFIARTPKDINWWDAFEKFQNTEPYKSTMDSLSEFIKNKPTSERIKKEYCA